MPRQRRRRPDPNQETGLRVIGGSLRGRRLTTPHGQILRPMRDRVREALFNALGPDVLFDANVLDLFSGSGSLGIEALSRGARRAVFVDRHPKCLAAIRANLSALDLNAQARVVEHDLAAGLTRLATHGSYDLVILHPPFALLREAPGPGDPDVSELLASLTQIPNLLSPRAFVAFETPLGCYPEPDDLAQLGLDLERRKDYGTTTLFLAQALEAPEE